MYLLDRGYDKTLLFFSGWALDEQVILHLDLPFNLIVLPAVENPRSILSQIEPFLHQRGITSVTVMGFSMGAFLATEFAQMSVNLISQLILVGVRPLYDPVDLEEIRVILRKQPAAFLRSFYRACFSSEDTWDLFREKSQNKVSLSILESGLDYLASVEWSPDQMPVELPWHVVHGTDDQIAPFVELLPLMQDAYLDRLVVLEGVGHLPFYDAGFVDALRFLS